MTTITAPTSTAVRHPAVLAAAVAYPAVWAAGLALGGGPALDAHPEAIGLHYAAAGSRVALQSVLVHGVAALALAVVGLAVLRIAGGTGRRAGRVAAVAVGVVVVTSVVQLALGVLASRSGGDVELASGLFGALNRLDAPKMVALAAMVVVGVLLARRGALPGWLAPVGAALVMALLVSALGYAVLATGPAAAAVVGLPLLLVWVCGAGVAAARR